MKSNEPINPTTRPAKQREMDKARTVDRFRWWHWHMDYYYMVDVMKKGYADLLMQNGEIVRIEFDEKNQDEIYENIDNCRKRGDWWPISMLDGTRATYMGIHIDRVNMKLVVAML